MNSKTKVKKSLSYHFGPQATPFIAKHIPAKYYRDYILIESLQHLDNLDQYEVHHLVVSTLRLNNYADINKQLRKIHCSLQEDGIFVGKAETLAHRKQCIDLLYNKLFSKIVFIYEFIFKRALPKLFGFRYLYRRLRILKNRVMSKCEILGRLRYCGFEVVDIAETAKLLYFVARKNLTPLYEKPLDSLLIKIRKVGAGGRIFYCYKLRTMHAYADYLHDYILKNQKIDNEGKVVGDFRKTGWGMLLRRTWLDEIPQLFNLLKGDMSFIGLRPLSQEFLSRYPEEWREERIKIKPGMIPPYYADCPRSFEEIIESEKKYYRLRLRHPVTTDIYYFIKVFINFALGRARTG